MSAVPPRIGASTAAPASTPREARNQLRKAAPLSVGVLGTSGVAAHLSSCWASTAPSSLERLMRFVPVRGPPLCSCTLSVARGAHTVNAPHTAARGLSVLSGMMLSSTWHQRR